MRLVLYINKPQKRALNIPFFRPYSVLNLGRFLNELTCLWETF